MLTDRDGQIVAWIGRIGPVGVEHVAGRFEICRGWARARHIDRVYYLATPKTARAVKRAASAANAADHVRVLALDDIPTLAEEVCDQVAAHRCDDARYVIELGGHPEKLMTREI